MSNTIKTILFGIVSGLIWSLIVFPNPGDFFGPSRQDSIFIVLSLGIATGIAVSFVLKAPLAKYGKLCGLSLGFLALPLAGVVFGFLFVLYAMLVGDFKVSLGDFFSSLLFILYGALGFAKSKFYLLPVSILTTFLLRMVVRSGNNNLSLKH
jgi:hypothetical protein